MDYKVPAVIFSTRLISNANEKWLIISVCKGAITAHLVAGTIIIKKRTTTWRKIHFENWQENYKQILTYMSLFNRFFFVEFITIVLFRSPAEFILNKIIFQVLNTQENFFLMNSFSWMVSGTNFSGSFKFWINEFFHSFINDAFEQ